ncbi:hypothetical protein GCM10007198_24170 [Microbacterium aerolatum]|uniref:Uncharacterized protein n=1 Tax=Microbacterium aerolatum TaxID=153731 RepID=A0A511AI06_9MICO|nr:hypothetical protein MAE01_29910 [Microbacterium aerolatum]GGB32792.1 hypothetical protein GCM10007198_24170 [Microbacterium aerolatum]
MSMRLRMARSGTWIADMHAQRNDIARQVSVIAAASFMLIAAGRRRLGRGIHGAQASGWWWLASARCGRRCW